MLILIMGLYASWVHAISNEISVLISLQVVSLKDNNWLEMEQIRKAPGLILKIQSKKKKKEVPDPPPQGIFLQGPRADLMECGRVMRLESMTLEWQKGSFLSDWAASSSFTWTLTRMDIHPWAAGLLNVNIHHIRLIWCWFFLSHSKSCQSYSKLVSGNYTIDINVAILGLCWQDNMFRESWMSQSESLRVHWYIHKYFCFHVWRQ